MKVADLQRYFTDLATLLQATDAKKSAAELARVSDGMKPFRDYDLAQFVSFLERAEGYARTGVLPVVEPKASSRSKAPPKPKADLSALRAEVVYLHGNAPSPDVTFELIEKLEGKLGALTKPELLPITDAIGLVGLKSKSKAEILNAIVSRIKSIKQSAIRTSISDRPGTSQ